ncbi:3-dehydrosphinganine reductase [Coemansia sp. RSA 2706]|nr:3-dehydrosphinganine reductase [Coemansia sp. RSA 2706]KAJ2366635.1 3-dehydrosphinganine reductase [Coemansia sp. RSA 2610]
MDDWRVALVTVFSVLGGILALGLANEVYIRATAPKFDVRNKHCYVTGGSQGLGKSVAQDLARRGAHVTIVARREAILKEAIAEIKAAASSPKEQKFEYIVADVTSAEGAAKAVAESERLHGRPVDCLFTVAGTSNPGVFAEQSTELIGKTMELNYFGTMYTVHAVTKRMIEARVKGRIVMVSSVLGFFGLVGYAGYCPSKFAVRGLAEALRVELLAHGINVHCYFPGTIFTPGYEAENLTKPAVTKDIEGADEGMSPEKCSAGLFNGLKRGEFAIATDPIGMLFRCTTRGVMPNNNFVLDSFIAALGWLAFVPWRALVDHTVMKFANKAKKE